jgi:D-amino peptidase
MEGVAGIATRRQVIPGRDDYAVGRQLMTLEATAAIEGAFDGGAREVIVNDSHGPMDNLIGELLDPRAEYVVGSPKPLGMVECLTAGIDVVFFVGYHAGPMSEHGVLAHSFSGAAFTDLRLNGESVTEAEVNGLLASSFNVPVGLLTGDGDICRLSQAVFPDARTVAVKEGIGVTAARSLHPATARDRIREAAMSAIEAASGSGLGVRPVPEQLHLEADARQAGAVEVMAMAPGTRRVGARTVRFEASSATELLAVIMTWSYLSAGHAASHS